MMHDETPSGTRPHRISDDVLATYRMMPTSDIERLLERIAWLEAELATAVTKQTTTEQQLRRFSRLLERHKGDLHRALDRFAG